MKHLKQKVMNQEYSVRKVGREVKRRGRDAKGFFFRKGRIIGVGIKYM